MVFYFMPGTCARIELRNHHFEAGYSFDPPTTENIEAAIGITFLY